MPSQDDSSLARAAGHAEDLAAQALDNLVDQFARPLDFLRELVQNAIDAGSPRSAIWFRFRPAREAGLAGVLEIHVDDQGEGMDESVIDNELTRMFSSSKEDDLTKIGKFGIGFTSIFAIRPDGVLLRTGRHGENWELLFHPDRSFDKVRIDEPVDGTRITLFKAMAAADVPRFVARCRWTVRYWLEHSDTPVLFGEPDLSWSPDADAPAPSAADPDDPFAAFAGAPSKGGHEPGCLALEPLNGPMELDAELVEEVRRGDIIGLVGYAETPLHAFYNGGLTLVRSSGGESLGSYGPLLGHLAFKIKSPHLEHTLTRDNVLQDEAWIEAMQAISDVVPRLREQLRARIAAETSPHGNPDPWLEHLVQDCNHAGDMDTSRGLGRSVVLPMVTGEPASLEAVEKQEGRLGAVLLGSAHPELDRRLAADGVIVLADRPAVRAVLRSYWKPGWLPWSPETRALAPATAVFALPVLLEVEALERDERELLVGAQQLLRSVLKSRVVLAVGDYGGRDVGLDSPLMVDGPGADGVFRRGRGRWVPGFARRRCLIVNRHHAGFRSQVVACHEHPAVAAYALVAMLLHEEAVEGEDTYRRLLARASATLVGAAS